MGPDDIWTNYIRYIGAGAVAAGGIINLVTRAAHHHRFLPRLVPRPAADAAAAAPTPAAHGAGHPDQRGADRARSCWRSS